MASHKQLKLVACPGELLIDFISPDQGKSIEECETFVKKLGGASGNVACCISQLGGRAAYLGGLGNDSFGRYLLKVIDGFNVIRDDVQISQHDVTTLAFVSHDENKEPSFEFIKGAVFQYTVDEIPKTFKEADLVHFGGAFAFCCDEHDKLYPLGQSYEKLINFAKKEGKFICFDPNFREFLFPGPSGRDDFIKAAINFLTNKADMVKFSLVELELITGQQVNCATSKSPQEMKTALDGMCRHIHEMGVSLIVVTLGKEGSFLSYKGQSQLVNPHHSIVAADTTGAGDALLGAVLYKLSAIDDIRHVTFDQLIEIIKFGNKIAGQVCTEVGAIEALKRLERDNAD